jgi:glutathione-regulated potassium-efflux system ancillary protein KefG
MKILVLFAHPRFSRSVVQKAMLAAITGLDGVTIHDLYAAYPDFAIDVPREQKLLLEHDLIVFQHPFYWYSCPAIVKEWLDLVLENGWAYGPGGTKLAGKFMLSAVSTGGSEMAYHADGRNRFEIRKFFAPFEQTAHLCGMAWLEPFAVFAARRAAPGELTARAQAWRDLIVALRDRRLDPMAMLAQGYDLPPAFAAKAA